MIFENRCYNGGNRHNFEPRYNNKSVSLISDDKHITSYSEYIWDICTWCGTTIEIEDEDE